jgi:hypothetical protein
MCPLFAWRGRSWDIAANIGVRKLTMRVNGGIPFFGRAVRVLWGEGYPWWAAAGKLGLGLARIFVFGVSADPRAKVEEIDGAANRCRRR